MQVREGKKPPDITPVVSRHSPLIDSNATCASSSLRIPRRIICCHGGFVGSGGFVGFFLGNRQTVHGWLFFACVTGFIRNIRNSVTIIDRL